MSQLDLNRACRAVPALVAFAIAGFASATPPPPPPTRVVHGPAALCGALYGIRLYDGEEASLYFDELWAVTAPGLELGIRTDLPNLEGRTAPVTVPGLGTGRRQRILEYPGNRPRGWTYAFPTPRGEAAATIRIASYQFRGTEADYPLLRRVLFGSARDSLCRPER